MNFEGSPSAPATQRALLEEQKFTDCAYHALDTQTDHYKQQLSAVRAQGATGTPSARSERDSFAIHYEDNLLRLRNVENRLVLGRLDFTEPASSSFPAFIHIGRITLRDQNRNILLTDWRAPQSEPFYQATAAHAGNVTRRRHIQTRFRKVTGVEDELLNTHAGAGAGLNLTGEGALIAAMSTARDGKMTDIVATIQAEQDRVIRSHSKGVLVVQGGPGTGKTAVALHRAAYLLYTERERLAGTGVLLIGPSTQFLHYIDQVLPSLGESNVVATTIGELFPGVKPTITDSPRAEEIKSRLIWRTIARRAVPAILQKPLTQPFTVKISGKNITLHPSDVADAQRRARQSGKPHNKARTTYAKYLVDLLANRLALALETTIDNSDWLVADVASDPDVRREINRHWLPASAPWLLEHMFAWPEVLRRVAPELSADEQAELRRTKGSGFSSADIPLLDELAEHLGEFSTDIQRHGQPSTAGDDQQLASYVSATMASMGLGGGIVSSQMMVDRLGAARSHMSMAEIAAADRAWTYGHVVVDEAQELTPMQWAMVARRNPARSMTIVGDVDQRVNTNAGSTWNELLGELGQYAHVEELTISYRTPSSILDRAANTMAHLGVHVRPVHGVRDLPDSYSSTTVSPDCMDAALEAELARLWNFLDSEYGEGLGSLAIIAPSNCCESTRASVNCIAQKRGWNDAMTHSSGERARIVVLSAAMAKGLEYDGVIVLNPSDVARESLGNLYVALTRATKKLTVLSSKPLPSGL